MFIYLKVSEMFIDSKPKQDERGNGNGEVSQDDILKSASCPQPGHEGV